jgi:PBSX family phage terminase large subunit
MPKFTLHKFQERAFLTPKPIKVMVAGIQSGKTITGALSTGSTMPKLAAHENMIMCAPTYKILNQATLPTFLNIFGNCGEHKKLDAEFHIHGGGKIYIRSLTDPNSMEGITNVRHIWLDEGGLISRYAWENVLGRAAFKQAPVIVTTTPYALNWIYQLWKEWKAGKREDVEFIQFRSIDNPHFPLAEFERQMKILDSRRFKMKYCGEFGKMEGLVYEEINLCKARELPSGTKFYGGIDWGYTNPFALTIRAVTPQNFHYRVSEFYKSGLVIDEIINVCRSRRTQFGIEYFVADPSSPSQIRSMNEAGLTCIPGDNRVRAGTDLQIKMIKEERFFVFEDENPLGIDEYNSYHYPEPKDYKIDQDQKEQEPVDSHNHGIDADRYVSMHLEGASKKHGGQIPTNKMPEDNLRRIEWLKRGGKSIAGV